MYVTWAPEMAVDDGMIDDDHRTIIEIINDFIDLNDSAAGPDNLAQTLLKLGHYATVHFKREELLQRQIRYPYAEAHGSQHQDIVKQLDMFRRRYFIRDAPREGLLPLQLDLRAFLRTWFLDHVIQSDLRMRPYSAFIRRWESGRADLSRAVSMS